MLFNLFKKSEPAPKLEMREARIIMPLMDNNGESLFFIHANLRRDLLNVFGGFTESRVTGQWRDSDSGMVYMDESLAFDIAAIWTPDRCESLAYLAGRYCFLAEQVCLYVRHDNGVVSYATPINGRANAVPLQPIKRVA